MIPNLQLPAYPSCKSCLAWSEDGELAVAAGESVYIHIPRRRRTGRPQDPRAGPFTSICLQVNSFTSEEWPRDEPLSFSEFSLGEEQSLSTVVALAWSPPGPAKHKRSVLAVLTSNLRLSLWTSTSDPESLKTWKRIIVVNHALKTYFEPLLDLDTEPPESTTAKFQSMCRIRSFAWTQPVREVTEDAAKPFENHWGLIFIAIANDNNQVILVRIRDGYTVIPSTKYRAQICCHFSCDTQHQALIKNGVTSTSSMDEANGMVMDGADGSNANTDWIYPDLTKTIEEHSWRLQDSMLGPNQELDSSHQYSESPLQFDMVEDYSLLKTALDCRPYAEKIGFSGWVSKDGLYAIVVSYVYKGNTKYKILTLSVGGLTGATTMTVLADPSRIDLQTLALYKQSFDARNPSSPIYKKMLQCRADFDDEHNLGGLAMMKIWGLAWREDIELACITCHPGDMVEYTIPSRERCTLVFHDHNDRKDLDSNTNPLGALVKHSPVSSESVTNAQEDIIHGIFSFRRERPLTILGAKIIHAGICASLTIRHSEAPAEEVLGDTSSTVENPTPTRSAESIGRIHQYLNLRPSNHIPANRTVAELFSDFHKAAQESQSFIFETCTICNQLINFQSLFTDLCPNNHAFGRCALTFLAITEPGISKYCAGCNRAFLNEEILLDANKEVSFVEDEAVRSALFELADACLSGIDGPEVSNRVYPPKAPNFTPEIHPPTVTENGTTEAMDIDNPLENVTQGTTRPPTNEPLAYHLFTSYAICPYCSSKYVG